MSRYKYAFQDRAVVAIIIHRTPLEPQGFFCILTKFGHSLHGETFLGVDEVFFFQLVKEILLLELKNVLLIHVCANGLHAFAELFLDMTQRNIKGLRFP